MVKTKGNREAVRLYPDLGACERCGKPAEQRHHRDGDTSNNERTNIAFVCHRCHMVMDGRIKLNDTIVANLRRRYAQGESPRSLARELGLTETPVRRAITGESWQHVPVPPPEPRPQNAVKTHCKHGHEFTPENTRVTARGERECLRCRRERNAAITERRRARAALAEAGLE